MILQQPEKSYFNNIQNINSIKRPFHHWNGFFVKNNLNITKSGYCETLIKIIILELILTASTNFILLF